MGWLDDISGDDWLNFGGSLVNSWMGADAAKDALKAQKKATGQANDMTWKMYQQTRQDQLPWLNQGTNAVNRLGYLLGLSGQPTGTATAPATPAQNPNQDRGRTYDIIRKIGAANSLNGQDTRLAHVNPREEAMLRANGGSGRIDPITGLPHYEENDDNAGYDADGGGGWTDGGGRHHTGANDGNPGGPTTSHRYEAPNPLKQKLGSWAGGMVGGALLGPVGKTLGSWAGGKWGQGGMVSNNNYGGGNSPASGGRGGWNDWGSRSGDGGIWSPIPQNRADYSGGWSSLGGNGITGTTINGPTTNPTTTTTGTTGTGDDGLYGSLMRDFGMADYQADPGYAFRLSQGNDALEKSAAMKGTLKSGQFLKDLMNFNQGLASQEYGTAYDRYMNNRSSKYNMLASLAGLGQTTAGTLGNYGLNTANTMGNNWNSLGDASAASQIAQSNAWQGGINNALNYWNYLNYPKSTGTSNYTSGSWGSLGASQYWDDPSHTYYGYNGAAVDVA